LLTDLGLDFNREKLYQSGFEFRSFDEFPEGHLPAVLQAIVLISEHALQFDAVPWCTDNITWNNIVFRSLKEGHKTIINAEEQKELLQIFKLNDIVEAGQENQKLDAFFFGILEILHNKYQDENQLMDLLLGQRAETAPNWSNFNQYQVEQHLAQLRHIES